MSGGGARGAYEAGVASALMQDQTWDIVCGASIGAINAAFVAAQRPHALETFWCDVHANARAQRSMVWIQGGSV